MRVLLQRRVWQVPMLAMFSVTFLGTVMLHLLILALSAVCLGTAVPRLTRLGLITLPSVLLNMLIAIPIFGLMRDVAHWVFRRRSRLMNRGTVPRARRSGSCDAWRSSWP